MSAEYLSKVQDFIIPTRFEDDFMGSESAFRYMWDIVERYHGNLRGYRMKLELNDMFKPHIDQYLYIQTDKHFQNPVSGVEYRFNQFSGSSIKAYRRIFPEVKRRIFRKTQTRLDLGLVTAFDLRDMDMRIGEADYLIHQQGLLIPKYAEPIARITSGILRKPIFLQIDGTFEVDRIFAESRGYSEDKNNSKIYKQTFEF